MIKKELINAVASIPFYYTKILLKLLFRHKILPYDIYKGLPEYEENNEIIIKKNQKKYYQSTLNLDSWQLKNVKVIGQEGLSVKGESIIVNGYYSNAFKNGHFARIGPLSIKYHANFMLQSFKYPKEKTNIKKGMIMTSIWSENYYHWMIDILPKIILYEMLESPSMVIVVNRMSSKFQEESLKMINQDIKYIETSNMGYIRVDEAIIPFLTPTESWKISFLRKRFQKLMVKSDCKRIYISRKLTNTRRILNEEKIMSLLTEYNFEKVFLENISFKDQVKMFYNSEIIVAPHGAGLTNLVFCQKETKIIELFPYRRINNIYKTIADLLNLEYYKIIDKKKYIYNRKNNIKVNHGELKKLLESILNSY